MSTTITRRLVRQTAARDPRTGKPIMVELGPIHFYLWAKGDRKKYRVSWNQAWLQGARNKAEEEKRARAEERAARRQARRGQ